MKVFSKCFVWFVALVLVVTAGVLMAQVGTGSITGTVTDNTGAVVVGASVTVTNNETGVAIHLVSNTDGRYVAPDINVGVYNITVQAKGFKAEKHVGVELLVGRQMVVDFPLTVGEQSETVTVQGEASQVETTTSEVSAQIGQSQMRDLPLNGRNYSQLILLAPGVQQITSGQSSGFGGRSDAISVSGSRPEGEAYLLDGVEINNFWNSSSGMGVTGESLGVDAIGEFQVLTNTYSARFGGNGSVMNATTRSGTNQLHGSVYEYIRNSSVDAKNYFDLASTAIPAFRRNQFGGTLGGPIKKDKSFVFMNYEGFRQLLGETMGVVVPDAQARLGIINGVNYNPLNPAIAATLALYPAPPATATELGGGEAQFSRVAYQPAREDYAITRWDYTLGAKDNLFARYVIDDGILTEPFAEFPTPLGVFPEVDPGRNQYLTIGERRLVSNTLVNDARVSYVRTNNTAHTNFETPALEFIPGSGFQNGTVSVTGLATLGPDVVTPMVQIQDTYSAGDDVVWTRGKHTLSFGLEFSRVQTHTASSVFTNGGWTFDSMQDFLLDVPDHFEGAIPGKGNSYRTFFETHLSPYVEDDWKVLPSLTLNLGVRYGWVSNPTEKNDYLCAFINPASPTVTGCQDVPNVFVSNPTKKAFDPRVGFSWAPFKGNKTAIRGGVGLFHDPVTVRTYNASYEFTSPYVSELELCGTGIPFPPCTTFPTPMPFAPIVFTGNGVAYSVNTTPFVMQYNIGVQRQVGAGTVLNVAYIGSRGYNLLQRNDLNPPLTTTVNGAPNFGGASPSTGGIGSPGPRANPNLGALPFDLADSSSWYNALQIYLTRNVGKTVQFQLNYTFSKSTDYDSNDFGAVSYNSTDTQYNPYNLAIEKGPSNFDVRNAFTGNAVYNFPFEQNALVKGWMYSIIATVHSGNPFTVYDGFDRADLGDPGGIGSSERPDLVPGKSGNPKVGNAAEWYDPSAFSLQYPGSVGDLGRNTLTAPGLVDFDMTLGKLTQITERLGMNARFELFNIINHPNFALPDQSLYSGPVCSAGIAPGTNCIGAGAPNPDAGAIHSTVSPSRQMQLSVKFQF